MARTIHEWAESGIVSDVRIYRLAETENRTDRDEKTGSRPANRRNDPESAR